MFTLVGFLVVAYFVTGAIMAGIEYMQHPNSEFNTKTIYMWLPELIKNYKGKI